MSVLSDFLALPSSGSIVGGVLGAGTNLATGIMSYNAAREERAQQMAIQREQWSREDTAMQRARADAEAAGFSPLVAVGSPSATTVSYDGSAAASMENAGYASMNGVASTLGAIGSSIDSLRLQKRKQDADISYQKSVVDAQLMNAETARYRAQTERMSVDSSMRINEETHEARMNYMRDNPSRNYGDSVPEDVWMRLVDGLINGHGPYGEALRRLGLDKVIGDTVRYMSGAADKVHSMTSAFLDFFDDPLGWLTNFFSERFGKGAKVTSSGEIDGRVPDMSVFREAERAQREAFNALREYNYSLQKRGYMSESEFNRWYAAASGELKTASELRDIWIGQQE